MKHIFIDEQYVDNWDKLKEILNQPIDSTSSLANEICDCVSGGVLADWFETCYPSEIAIINELRQLSDQENLSSSELVGKVIALCTQSSANVTKPEFSQCAKIVSSKATDQDNGLLSFRFCIEVKRPINETYELGLKVDEASEQYVASKTISLDLNDGEKELVVEFNDISGQQLPSVLLVDGVVVLKIKNTKRTDRNLLPIGSGNSLDRYDDLDTSTRQTFLDYFKEYQFPKPSKKYKVGDFYDDGIRQGIVFWVDESGYNGKIVNIFKDGVEKWQRKNLKIDILHSDSDSTNGFNNQRAVQRAIQQESGEDDNFPAFRRCTSVGRGWYLPAKEELRAISDNLQLINSEIELHNGTTLEANESYWSSTYSLNPRYAYYYDFIRHRTDDTFRTDYRRVRAVAIFTSLDSDTDIDLAAIKKLFDGWINQTTKKFKNDPDRLKMISQKAQQLLEQVWELSKDS